MMGKYRISIFRSVMGVMGIMGGMGGMSADSHDSHDSHASHNSQAVSLWKQQPLGVSTWN
jgi:hypothetical protein